MSKTPLFEATRGLSLFTNNTLAVNFSHGVPASGLFWRRATRYDPLPQIEAYRLAKVAGRYRAEPVGSSIPVTDGGWLALSEPEDLPFQGRYFSLHSSGEGPGRLILQVEPLKPDGDYEYFLGFAYSYTESPDLTRLLYQTEILNSYAEEVAEGLEGAIRIDVRNGVRIDDKTTLLTFLKAYNSEKQQVFGNTTSAPSLANIVVAARSDEAERALIRAINKRACLLMAGSPYQHLRPMGMGVPKGIERADMRAEEADQVCRTALRFGADSQAVRYAAFRAGSEASTRAGLTERLPELRRELERLADEGLLAARTEVALLNVGRLGVPTNLDKLRDMLLAEHESGNPVASYFLGFAIVEGHVPAEDKSQGLPYLEVAAKGGVSRAHWMNGRYHLRQHTSQSAEMAFLSFLKGADENEPRSMTAAADRYLSGNGVDRQPEKAFELYREAARIEEIGRALHMLGYMRLHGIGTFDDMRTAREYFQRAVERGFAAAKSELGYMYLAGLGGSQNIEAGEAYLRQASQAGFFSAEYYRRRYESELANQEATDSR